LQKKFTCRKKKRIREKEGRMDIKGEKAFKKSRRKEKSKVGVAYDPMITKIKTLSFGKFTKQNQKYLQVKSPLEGIYILLTFHNLWKEIILFQHLHLHIFPK
jgi:hypothetical protein